MSDGSGVNARIELQDGNHDYSNNWDGTGGIPPHILLTKNDIISYVDGILFFLIQQLQVNTEKKIRTSEQLRL